METMKSYKLNTRLIATLPRVLRTTHSEMSRASGITNTTWYKLISQPDTISVQQLLAIVNSQCIPVRKFFYPKTAVIGLLEDYVVFHDFKPCSYNVDAVRHSVGPGTATSWRKVAEAIGMHWTSAAASLLAERPLPVLRLLKFCNAFDFDVFEFLTDDNPEHTTSGKRAEPNLHNEIAAMREDIRLLSDSLEDLKSKYETLIKDHNDLLHRISVNIEHFQDSHLSIAAEPAASYNSKG